jgi:hypothetical protein
MGRLTFPRVARPQYETRTPHKDRRKRQETGRQRLSPQRKPEHRSLEERQVALRQEFGRKQSFRLKNVGDNPIFSCFAVTKWPGMSYCAYNPCVVRLVEFSPPARPRADA